MYGRRVETWAGRVKFGCVIILGEASREAGPAKLVIERYHFPALRAASPGPYSPSAP